MPIVISLGMMGRIPSRSITDEKDARKGSQSYRDYFKKLQYYSLFWEEEQRQFHLSADELQSNRGTGKVIFINPSGTVDLKGQHSLFYRGARGHFDDSRDELHLMDEVVLSEGNSRITSDRAIYQTRRKELKLSGEVVGWNRFDQYKSSVRIRSQEAFARLLQGKIRYSGNVTGRLESFREQQQGELFFSSAVLDMDLRRYRLDISDDVTFKREQFAAQGNRGEIFLNKKGRRVEHYTLHDNVRLREKVKRESGQSYFERTAMAEKLEGTFGDNRIVLTGRPRVIQEKDVIKGNQIILRKDIETVEVDDASANFELR